MKSKKKRQKGIKDYNRLFLMSGGNKSVSILTPCSKQTCLHISFTCVLKSLSQLFSNYLWGCNFAMELRQVVCYLFRFFFALSLPVLCICLPASFISNQKAKFTKLALGGHVYLYMVNCIDPFLIIVMNKD